MEPTRGAMPAILELRDASKHFGGVPALRGVGFSVHAGQVHALVGENGAGKSTLVNILSGVLVPDDGALLLDGEPVRFSAPLEANRRGIHLVHQELALLPESTVTENVFLGAELTGRLGTLDWRAMRARTEAILAELGSPIDADRRVSSLTVAQRQMVEIARALVGEARVVILDEPTAALDARSEYEVFQRFADLTHGKMALLISHRFSTVRMADRIVVLEDGRIAEEGTHDGLISLGGRYAGMFELQASSYR